MQSNSKGDRRLEHQRNNGKSNCLHRWRWQWCCYDLKGGCRSWYRWKRGKISITCRRFLRWKIRWHQKIDYLARKTFIQKKCFTESIRRSSRYDYLIHPSYLHLHLLLRYHSYLQWISTARLLNDLHYVPSIFTSAGWRCLLQASEQIPSTLQDYSERPISQFENILDLDLEINLLGK